jgi:hypothetical protein
MHQHPPKIPLCFSTRRAKAGQVAWESGFEVRAMVGTCCGCHEGRARNTLPGYEKVGRRFDDRAAALLAVSHRLRAPILRITIARNKSRVHEFL